MKKSTYYKCTDCRCERKKPCLCQKPVPGSRTQKRKSQREGHKEVMGVGK